LGGFAGYRRRPNAELGAYQNIDYLNKKSVTIDTNGSLSVT